MTQEANAGDGAHAKAQAEFWVDRRDRGEETAEADGWLDWSNWQDPKDSKEWRDWEK